jgi:membrane associated rhomboid family serine protease
VVVLFLGKEIMNMFQNDSVSQSAHIIGGVCGSIFGFTHQKQG